MPSNDLPGTSAARHGSDDRLIAMHAAHAAFRRDLERMAATATKANLRDPARHQSILNGWAVFKNQIHIHHDAEDTLLWPRLRKRLATSESAISTLDAMDEEHALIDPLLAAVDDAFDHTEKHDTVADVIDELNSKLRYHLEHEEREALPMIGEAITDKEWKTVTGEIRKSTGLTVGAEFVPWLADGVSADEAKRLIGTLPPPVRVLYRRIWKPKYDKVSHW